MSNLLKWHIYDITATISSLNGVMLRGRIRKFGVENDINVIAENTTDRENGVRFAVLSRGDAESISDYLSSIADDIEVSHVESGVVNPVLSKLKVNIAGRYKL